MAKLSYREYRKLKPRQIADLFKRSDEWYDYVTALRGPDSNGCTTLKDLFTGFLRGRVTNGPVGIRNFEETIQYDSKAIAGDLLDSARFNHRAMGHWLTHVNFALKRIEKRSNPNLQAIAYYLTRISELISAQINLGGSSREGRAAIASFLEAIESCVKDGKKKK